MSKGSFCNMTPIARAMATTIQISTFSVYHIQRTSQTQSKVISTCLKNSNSQCEERLSGPMIRHSMWGISGYTSNQDIPSPSTNSYQDFLSAPATCSSFQVLPYQSPMPFILIIYFQISLYFCHVGFSAMIFQLCYQIF